MFRIGQEYERFELLVAKRDHIAKITLQSFPFPLNVFPQSGKRSIQ